MNVTNEKSVYLQFHAYFTSTDNCYYTLHLKGHLRNISEYFMPKSWFHYQNIP